MDEDITTSTTSSSPENFTSESSEGCLVLATLQRNSSTSSPSPDISPETWKLLSQSGTVLITLICLVGVPANLLNLVVFYAQGFKNKVMVCMFAQSFDDLAVLLTYLCWNFDTLLSMLSGVEGRRLTWLRFLVNNYVSVAIVLMYVSGFLSAVIAVERWAVVQRKSKVDGERIGVMVGVVIVAHILLLGSHVVVSAGIEVACVMDPETNLTRDVLLDSAFKLQHPLLFRVTHSVFFGLLLPGTCLLLTTLAILVTLIELKKQLAWRAQASSTSASGGGLSSREVNLTRVLVGVSVVYVVCSVPRMAGRFSLMLEDRLGPGGELKHVFHLLILTQQVFTCLNSSLNFFVYWALGTKFKATLTSLLACGCKARSSSPRLDLPGGHDERVQVSTVTMTTTLKPSTSRGE